MFTKVIILIISMMPIFFANATDKVFFKCQNVNGADATIAYLANNSSEDDSELTFSFTNTTGEIPIQADPGSPISIGDLSYYAKKAALFKKVGSTFKITFKKSDCIFEERNGQKDHRCYARTPGKIGQLNYDSAAMFIYTQNIVSPYSKGYKSYNVGWDITVDHQIYTVTVPFYGTSSSEEDQTCKFTI